MIEKIDEVAMYFKNTYVENPLPNRPPKFNIGLWNHHGSTTEGIARTNNAVEGWHYGLQTYFNGSHPNMWVVLANLKKDMAVQKFSYIQYTQGAFVPRRQKYEKINKTAQNILANADYNGSVVPFLLALAKLNTC